LCEQNGLKNSGNKADLLARLNGMDDVSVEISKEKIRIDCPSCSKTLMYHPGTSLRGESITILPEMPLGGQQIL